MHSNLGYLKAQGSQEASKCWENCLFVCNFRFHLHLANFSIRPGTKVVDDTILLCILVWLTTCKNEGQGDVSKFVGKCTHVHQKYGFVGTVAKCVTMSRHLNI